MEIFENAVNNSEWLDENDGVNRIQKQVLRPRNRNFEAGILTDDPALVAAASNIALIPSISEKSKKTIFV